MKTCTRWGGTWAIVALALAAGCAKGTEPSTATAPTAPTADRQLMAVDDQAPPAAPDRAALPTRIEVADAGKMLIHISDDQVAPSTTKSYSLMRHGGGGGGFHSHGFGGHGHGWGGHGYGGYGYGGYGWGGLGWGGLGWGGFGWPGYAGLGYGGLYGGLGYLGVGSYAYPYSLINGAYSPYTYGYGGYTVNPFLYRPYGGLYRPYFSI